VVDVFDSHFTLLTVHVAAANQSEVNLIEPTLDNLPFENIVPEHLIDDRAADSDPLRERLAAERGIALVCPHRQSRKHKATPDGRACRRSRRRCKVERTHSWFHNFRRTIIRCKTTLVRCSGWIHLACVILTLRWF
jgi:transposase